MLDSEYSQKMMRILVMMVLGALLTALPAAADEETSSAPKAEKTSSDDTLDQILAEVEKRYSGSGFIAFFSQKSTIRAMDITDTAEGKVFIKRPGMMRWEYEKPDKQIILTDGEELWIFRPDDNQVMTGAAPVYFGDGKGAGILSDIRIIREKFRVEILDDADTGNYHLKLIPNEKQLDLSEIRLTISKSGYEVKTITTYNAYEDETHIEFSELQFDQKIDDSVFSFQIPEGADIVQLDEQ